MRSRLEIRREFKDKASATQVMRSLRPDNLGVPSDTQLRMRVEGAELIIEVSSKGDLNSFLRTVDDLLLCIQAAEGAQMGVR